MSKVTRVLGVPRVTKVTKVLGGPKVLGVTKVSRVEYLFSALSQRFDTNAAFIYYFQKFAERNSIP